MTSSKSNTKSLLESEPTMGVKMYNGALLTFDILVLIINLFIEWGKAIYGVFVSPEEKSVAKEVVLITGAGHGIGKEMALQYGALGATVVCWDINDSNNKQTVKEIQALKNGKAHSYICDVSKEEEIKEVAKKVQTEVGNVTILINNAGIMPSHPLMNHTTSEIRKMFDINVLAHFSMIQTFMPSMIEKNHGHIVALSSMAGIVGFPNLVPYCGTKYAVRGYMEALSEELRTDSRDLSGIKFTTIYPYMVDTGLCKVVNIRFPSLMPIVKPKDCAAAIIKAQRQEKQEATVPPYLFNMNAITRTFPNKMALLIKDFIDSGVGSDLNVK